MYNTQAVLQWESADGLLLSLVAVRSVENGGLARLRITEAKGILASFLFQEFNIYSYTWHLPQSVPNNLYSDLSIANLV